MIKLKSKRLIVLKNEQGDVTAEIGKLYDRWQSGMTDGNGRVARFQFVPVRPAAPISKESDREPQTLGEH